MRAICIFMVVVVAVTAPVTYFSDPSKVQLGGLIALFCINNFFIAGALYFKK